MSLQLLADFSLRPHNTFGFDERARYALRIDSVDAAAALASDARIAGMPWLVLGGGSNIVLTRNFDGVALIVGIAGKRVIGEDDGAWLAEAGAGENWHAFVAWTLAQGMPGLENLALIPGTVGAAPLQNIGAYGLEMGERFERLHAVELATGAHVAFDRETCAFGYRDSFFKREGCGRFMVTSVVFRLPKAWTPRADYADVARALESATTRDAQAIFDAVIAVRRAKLPDWTQLGNAGSFFKNPVIGTQAFDALKAREPNIVSYPQADGTVKLAAGWLIDQCGWKGRGIGGAAVHDRQALVLVNRGGATGAQVLELAEAIKRDVFARFGVELEMEPVCL
ncbi:UDP-N-acetylenolpyruvoylglucosamine reductase [Candidatus Burkholderia brachyanthoides]|nr:UDP-N-acetylenolpyruvoylglucosamine reductase [Candidatus Burkholderia brachyanthoides]